MGLKQEEIKNLILEAIPDAEIAIEDLAGDENHYSATIKSKVFIGKSKIEQHKLVYKALKGKMGNELHALALNTMER
jgi:stress-induced morphogen